MHRCQKKGVTVFINTKEQNIISFNKNSTKNSRYQIVLIFCISLSCLTCKLVYCQVFHVVQSPTKQQFYLLSGCYGENLSDNESVSSVETDSSTEPWFCDACKAGVNNPVSIPPIAYCNGKGLGIGGGIKNLWFKYSQMLQT